MGLLERQEFLTRLVSAKRFEALTADNLALVPDGKSAAVTAAIEIKRKAPAVKAQCEQIE